VIVNLALALVNCMDRGTTVLAVKMVVVVDHAWRSLGRWPVCRRWAEPGNFSVARDARRLQDGSRNTCGTGTSRMHGTFHIRHHDPVLPVTDATVPN